MEFVLPALLLTGIALWFMEVGRSGEPTGDAVRRVLKKWGPVLIVGYLTYMALSTVMVLLTMFLVIVMVWTIFGALTGGFLWTDSSFTEVFGAFGVILVVFLLVFMALLIWGCVSLLRMVRTRMRDRDDRRAPVAGAASRVLPPPPPPPPPAPPVEAVEATPPTRSTVKRQRPLRAAGR